MELSFALLVRRWHQLLLRRSRLRTPAVLQIIGRTSHTNIHFADFAAEEQLNKRLEAGDVHLVSLPEEKSWTGHGRPLEIFWLAGHRTARALCWLARSSPSRWITQHEIGWHLHAQNKEQVAQELRALCVTPLDNRSSTSIAGGVYRQHFSQERQIQRAGMTC